MKTLIASVAVALSISIPPAMATPTTCVEVMKEINAGNTSNLGWYWQNCNAPAEQVQGRQTRATADLSWSAFKTAYANGVATEANLDAVAKALYTVFAEPGQQNCYSFDNAPGGGTAGFQSPPSSTKGFCRTLTTDGNKEQLTFGTVGTTAGTGTDGSYTAPGTREGTNFGPLPEASPGSSHTLMYVEDTMQELAIADPLATPEVINAAVTQMFTCAADGVALAEPAGCLIGDSTTGGQIFAIKISPTTGSWGLSGFPGVTYKK